MRIGSAPPTLERACRKLWSSCCPSTHPLSGSTRRGRKWPLRPLTTAWEPQGKSSPVFLNPISPAHGLPVSLQIYCTKVHVGLDRDQAREPQFYGFRKVCLDQMATAGERTTAWKTGPMAPLTPGSHQLPSLLPPTDPLLRKEGTKCC